MIRNYLKITLRNLVKHRMYSLINILGLAVGIACCILITLFVRYELSYDQYHSKADRIYRVTRDFLKPDKTVDLHLARIAPPFGPIIEQEFPALEAVVRTLYTVDVFTVGEQTFTERSGFFAEERFFDIFDVEVQQGNAKEALSKPFSIMLSEEAAEKYFKDESPVGKLIRWKVGSESFTLKVTGVFERWPENSHIHPNYLISFKTLENNRIYNNGPDPKNQGKAGLSNNWGNNSFPTYILLPEDYEAENIEKQFPALIDKYFGAFIKEMNPDFPFKASDFTHLYLQKLTDIHLGKALDNEIEVGGSLNNVYVFIIIGIFILSIAIINFINLATARSANRAKEVGIRKVIGAYKRHLIFQFLSESILITSIGLILALGIAELARPWLNELAARSLPADYLWSWQTWLGLISLIIVVGVSAGIYPALYLSSFQPVKVLKGRFLGKTSHVNLRKVLVVAQFTISIVLIISTIIVYQQITFMQNQELGYEKDHVVNLPNYSSINSNFEAFRQQLLENPAIRQVGRSSRRPTGQLLDSFGSAQTEVGDSVVQSKVVFKAMGADYYYFDAYQMKIVAGRSFSPDFGTDIGKAFVINEQGVKELGWNSNEEAIGKPFKYGGRDGRVVGVVQDVYFESMHEVIKPIAYVYDTSGRFYRDIVVKLQGNQVKAGLAHLEAIWESNLPNEPFSYTFLDDSFAQLYEQEERQGTMFFIFAGLAIFIACLGLFGLVSFITEQRTKEVGIRKVLGASIPNILGLISKDFVILVILASLFAFPLAYYAMGQWLQDFAYRISMHAFVFILAGLVALLISLLTISVHIYRVARVNPVNVLRNE